MENIAGKCHCGRNNFTVKSQPEFQFVCYCKNCRVINSGGHLCGLVFDAENFLAADHTQTYTYPGGSGNPIILHFCPTCATQLYAYPTEYKDKVVIRANALTSGEFGPQQAIFTESAFPWDKPVIGGK